MGNKLQPQRNLVGKTRISSIFGQCEYGPLRSVFEYLHFIDVIDLFFVCKAFKAAGTSSLERRKLNSKSIIHPHDLIRYTCFQKLQKRYKFETNGNQTEPNVDPASIRTSKWSVNQWGQKSLFFKKRPTELLFILLLKCDCFDLTDPYLLKALFIFSLCVWQYPEGVGVLIHKTCEELSASRVDVFHDYIRSGDIRDINEAVLGLMQAGSSSRLLVSIGRRERLKDDFIGAIRKIRNISRPSYYKREYPLVILYQSLKCWEPYSEWKHIFITLIQMGADVGVLNDYLLLLIVKNTKQHTEGVLEFTRLLLSSPEFPRSWSNVMSIVVNGTRPPRDNDDIRYADVGSLPSSPLTENRRAILELFYESEKFPVEVCLHHLLSNVKRFRLDMSRKLMEILVIDRELAIQYHLDILYKILVDVPLWFQKLLLSENYIMKTDFLHKDFLALALAQKRLDALAIVDGEDHYVQETGEFFKQPENIRILFYEACLQACGHFIRKYASSRLVDLKEGFMAFIRAATIVEGANGSSGVSTFLLSDQISRKDVLFDQASFETVASFISRSTYCDDLQEFIFWIDVTFNNLELVRFLFNEYNHFHSQKYRDRDNRVSDHLNPLEKIYCAINHPLIVSSEEHSQRVRTLFNAIILPSLSNCRLLNGMDFSHWSLILDVMNKCGYISITEDEITLRRLVRERDPCLYTMNSIILCPKRRGEIDIGFNNNELLKFYIEKYYQEEGRDRIIKTLIQDRRVDATSCFVFAVTKANFKACDTMLRFSRNLKIEFKCFVHVSNLPISEKRFNLFKKLIDKALEIKCLENYGSYELNFLLNHCAAFGFPKYVKLLVSFYKHEYYTKGIATNQYLCPLFECVNWGHAQCLRELPNSSTLSLSKPQV